MKRSSELLMPFIDGSESFTNGFECGQIWERLQSGEDVINQLVHTGNLKQLRMIAEHYGYSFECTSQMDTWSYVNFTINIKDIL